MRRAQNIKLPRLAFAAIDLKSGSGGIAELSRQVFRALLQLHRQGEINLEVHVLKGVGPAGDDPLFGQPDLPPIHWYSGSQWKIGLKLACLRAHVVLIDHVGLGRLMGIFPSIIRQNYLVLIHGVEIWRSDRKDYLRTAKRSTLLIANSGYTARKAREYCKDLPKICVCWPGKDFVVHEKTKDLVEDMQLGSHAMLIVGRLDGNQRHKGHDQLLEAMPLVLQAVPDAQLVVAGEGGDRDRLEAKARELGVTEKVKFLGWVNHDQLASLYSQSALFVMPSDGDGFGIVFLEAMMNGMPCVGLKEGAAAEIFENGKSGILVNRNDIPGMAEQLSDILKNDQSRKRLGDAARARFLSNFTGDLFADRFNTLLRRSLS